MTHNEYEIIRQILKDLQIALDECNQEISPNADYNDALSNVVEQILEKLKLLLNQDSSINIH